MTQLYDDLLVKTRELQRLANDMNFLYELAQLSLKIDNFFEKVDDKETNRPFCVAFLGGTGVGKSTLFNALLGKKDISPVSSERRLCTKAPYIAVSNKDRPLLGGKLDDTDPKYVTVDYDGLVVIDTPDINGIMEENHEVARKVVDMADIVIFVTSPDRVGDFDIHAEIREWATKKRWFFVLNKVDTNDEIGPFYDEKLVQLGFSPTDATRFMVSAMQPEDFDFQRLKRAIHINRSQEHTKMLRLDLYVGYLSDILRDEVLEPIHKKINRVRGYEEQLDQQARAIYQEGLDDDGAQHALREMLEGHIWGQIQNRIYGFFAIPIWIKCRGLSLRLGFGMGRMALRGPSSLNAIGVLSAIFGDLLKRFMPVQSVLDGFSQTHRNNLKELQQEARNKLVEEGLGGVCELEQKQAKSIAASWKELPLIGQHLDKMSNQDQEHQDNLEEIFPTLEQTIKDVAQEAITAALTRNHHILGNVLPGLIFFHIVWRMLVAWFTATWLPLSFYLMALLLFILSMVPGYWFLVYSVHKQVMAAHINKQVVAKLKYTGASQCLRKARGHLEGFITKATLLKSTMKNLRLAQDSGIDEDSFGGIVRQ